MKKIIIATFLLFQLSLQAQVGINTTAPTRTLDVNGDIRIRSVADKSENGNYSQVLIANDKGDVDHALRSDFLPLPVPDDAKKEVYNSIYNRGSDTANEEKIVKCGDFTFLFLQGTNTTDIAFYLNDPIESNVDIHVSMEQNWDNGFEFFQGSGSVGNPPVYDTKPFTFTKDNYNTARKFLAARVAEYEQNSIFLQYPNKSEFYKLTIYKVKQQTTWDFVTVCEKF